MREGKVYTHPIQPPDTLVLPGFGQAVDWSIEPCHLIKDLGLQTDLAQVERMLEYFRYDACNLEERRFG